MSKKYTIEIEKESLKPKYSTANFVVPGKKIDKTKIEELMLIIKENAKLEREEIRDENIRYFRHG
ncbi:MAG TPA: hypothetical protein PK950_03165 [Candidatus Paceibacterota bacterium]|nr:hypothetical protein [Candidatus Paceibacterota bacterium]